MEDVQNLYESHTKSTKYANLMPDFAKKSQNRTLKAIIYAFSISLIIVEF